MNNITLNIKGQLKDFDLSNINDIDEILKEYQLFLFEYDVFKITLIDAETVTFKPITYISSFDRCMPKIEFIKEIITQSEIVRYKPFSNETLKKLVGKIATDIADSFVSLITDFCQIDFNKYGIIIHGDSFDSNNLINEHIVIDGKLACNLEKFNEKTNTWNQFY